ncbi:MAG TPA: hypothetical protein VGL71_05085 [Urbifossiella sp.]
MLNKLYLLLGASLLGLYTTASFMGWEIGTPARETAQQSTARHASGGFRGFWITSFRGGK